MILADLNPRELIDLEYSWRFWARKNQIAPAGDWRTWLICAGRGFGKTRCGAEFVREEVDAGRASRVALVGRTAADTRDVMIEGESGLLSVFPDHQKPLYEPSKRRITFHTGAIATAFSADEPDLLRGPQHDLAWADELASWRRPEAWDNLQFGLRLGSNPRNVVTTTPKPTPLFRRVRHNKTTHATFGATKDNQANLAESFIRDIYEKYAGTRLGAQELEGTELTDVPGALWTWEMVERSRWDGALPLFTYVVIAVDPSVGELNKNGQERQSEQDECGIVICALGQDGFGYVLADRSLTASPDEWASVVEETWRNFTVRPNWVIAEKNNGGGLVSSVIKAKNPNIPVRLVSAAQGKRTRAEPVSMLYEQGRVRHVGVFANLEGQMMQWSPTESNWSPDRMDALVWGLTKLMVDKPGEFFVGVV